MSFVKRFQGSLESLYQLPGNTSATPSASTSSGIHYVVAYSGGVDSHVLLYCCKQLNLSVRAIHVHHGLQDVADDWVEHCQAACDQLSIPLDVLYVDAKKQQGQSPEEIARNVRYAAIYNNLNTGDCLITAQHENDQAETFLLQLFRTASAAGLAAMPAYRPIMHKKLTGAVHIRPLLSFSRNEIVDFAKKKNLHWVEDPSNQNTEINRNFIRKEVLPVLQKRWPQVISQLSTAASLQSGNLQVLEDMAAIDLASLISINQANNDTQSSGCTSYKVESQLPVADLKCLSSARLLNVLRLWIIRAAKKQPSRNLLSEIEKTLINSSQDAAAVVKFSAYEFRKFQNSLFLLKPESVTAEAAGNDQNSYTWHPQQTLEFPQLNLQISVQQAAGKSSDEKLRYKHLLHKRLLDETLSVCFRKGGERFHPAGRKHSQSLKKLLQEANIPPWERDLIPLVYCNDDLIAVGDLWVAKDFSVAADGWIVSLAKMP